MCACVRVCACVCVCTGDGVFWEGATAVSLIIIPFFYIACLFNVNAYIVCIYDTVLPYHVQALFLHKLAQKKKDEAAK